MHPTGVASAAWVFAAAPSKVPFYVAGGLLAGWAVALTAVGMTHPEFPGSAVRARLVMLTTGLLVAATVSAALVTAGDEEGATAAPSAAGAAGTLRLTADPTGQLAYDTRRATATAGRISVELVNESPVPHDVTIASGTRVVAQTKTIQGGTTSATAELAPGEYAFYCAVDGHRQAGMEGTLTVR